MESGWGKVLFILPSSAEGIIWLPHDILRRELQAWVFLKEKTPKFYTIYIFSFKMSLKVILMMFTPQ